MLCDVHPGMQATRVAAHSSRATVADESGKFSFTNVPVGRLQDARDVRGPHGRAGRHRFGRSNGRATCWLRLARQKVRPAMISDRSQDATPQGFIRGVHVFDTE